MKEKNIKLSPITKVLILDRSIGKVIDIFLDTFLAAYFYKITQQNILYLSIFQIISWIFATIGAFIVSDIIKRKNKVRLYQFGIFVKSFYIFMIIILGNKIINYIYFIGILAGIASSMTGFPLNMLESENVSNKERSKYIGYYSVATELISLIVPIFLGAFITIKSYEIAAILIFVFSIIKLIISFRIKNVNVQTKRIDLKRFYNILKKDTNLKKIYIIEFLKGINRYGVMGLVVSLLIIYQTNNEFELGGWTSLFSLFTIIAMYLFGKFYNKKQKKKLMIISLIALLISFGCILYKITMVTVIIYDIAYYVFMNIILKITEVSLFDYSNKEPFKSELNTEYFTFRELFLNIGRIIGYTFLLVFVGITQNLSNLNILFIFIISSIIIVVYMSNKLKIDNEKR